MTFSMTIRDLLKNPLTINNATVEFIKNCRNFRCVQMGDGSDRLHFTLEGEFRIRSTGAPFVINGRGPFRYYRQWFDTDGRILTYSRRV